MALNDLPSFEASLHQARLTKASLANQPLGASPNDLLGLVARVGQHCLDDGSTNARQLPHLASPVATHHDAFVSTGQYGIQECRGSFVIPRDEPHNIAMSFDQLIHKGPRVKPIPSAGVRS